MWLVVAGCLSRHLSGPLLGYLLGVYQYDGASVGASVRHLPGICQASLGVFVVATVRVSIKTSLGATLGASVRASVRVSVETSVGKSINLNCIMDRIMLHC